ncbi:putative E3 ubiquitin-protein ligase UBR7 [Bicyclus anynana]|uniref:E3 ubiquitin-protein ligase UBR7 n=1 Tax=Bicyclus anynana TaxID=110368 RepID=A0A6J1NGQ5_BICAN|nr:putative E3 ubiquitin-protein ligase UBR7 [Bicyclus anynana]
METEPQNTSEDAELADCDGEKVVTMMDVLQEQEDFEEDANAVLGASDDKNCTYSKGYIKRQAIYACMTCCSEAKDDPTKRAGVCLACSLVCHENHDLIELYTKRNFKCDCGNPKFNSHPCHFTPDKSDLNEENNYNHNFSGLYCVCQRPYPDPDSTVDVDMIQCVICEDWLHATHLEATVPDNDQYSEMICKGCMEKNYFLHDYSNLAINGDVDVVSNGIDNASQLCNGDAKLEIIKSESVNDVEMTEKAVINGSDDIKSNEETTEVTANGGCFDTPMETDERNVLDTNSTELDNEENNTSVSIDNAVDDTIKDIGILSGNNDKDINHQHESTIQEEHNKNKELTSKISETENAGEVENTEKSEEQLNEERLLADPDDNKKTNSETNGENNVPSAGTVASDENITTTNTENNKVNEEKDTEVNEEKDIEVNEEKHTEINEEMHTEVNEEKHTEVNEEKHTKVNEEKNTEVNEGMETDEEKHTEVNEGMQNKDNEEKHTEINEEKHIELNEEMHTEVNEEMHNEVNEVKHTEVNEEKHKEVNEEKQNELHEVQHNDEKQHNELSEEQHSDINKEQLNKDNEEQHNNVNEEKYKEIDEEKHVDESLPTDTASMESKETVNNNESHNGETELENNEKYTEKRKLSTEDIPETNTKKAKLNETNEPCVRPKGVCKSLKGATFWPSTFRQKLCTCTECITMYRDLSVLFLIDPEDTVTAYENLGKLKIDGKPATQYEKGLQALSSLDRIQQINALTEYNKMRDKLLDFLKSFKDKRQVVTEDDIRAFFAGMKPKREPDGVYFCR